MEGDHDSIPEYITTIYRKESPMNNHSVFVQMLSNSFSEYASKYPVQTGYFINSLLLPDNENFAADGEEYTERLKWAVSLLLLLPESVASKVMSDIRCLSNDESNQDFIKQFIFEMAVSESFSPSTVLDALHEFARLELSNPFGGIDRARIIGEAVYGTKDMVKIVNELTEMLYDTKTPGEEAN
ncbi:MAG TPA: hypothetical protein PKK43_11560 [Spirochaetota bacterium]|nr:hypothetical protein [Spirochaetota bacterium]